MSLYDDLVSPDEIRDDRKQPWMNSPSINLLQNHLAAKKHVKHFPPAQSFKPRPKPMMPMTKKIHPISSGTVSFHSSTNSTTSTTNTSSCSSSSSSCSNKASISLLGGDWNPELEYDPHWPNDYEKIAKERSKHDTMTTTTTTSSSTLMETKSRSSNSFNHPSFPPPPIVSTSFARRSLVDAYSDDEDDHDQPINSSTNKGGVAIAPPASLMEGSSSSSSSSNTTTSTNIQTSNFVSPIQSNFASNEAAGSSYMLSNMNVSPAAAKMMALMGYQEGKGLGKQKQGISTALQVEKTSKNGGVIVNNSITSNEGEFAVPAPPPPISFRPPTTAIASDDLGMNESNESITELMRNPTKVVMLRNMVGQGEVDADLEPEVREECSKFGEVISCCVYEVNENLVNGRKCSHLFRRGRVADEEAVRIFVEFRRVESAIKALVDLNGRYFGGRVVKGVFFDADRYKKMELND